MHQLFKYVHPFGSWAYAVPLIWILIPSGPHSVIVNGYEGEIPVVPLAVSALCAAFVVVCVGTVSLGLEFAFEPSEFQQFSGYFRLPRAYRLPKEEERQVFANLSEAIVAAVGPLFIQGTVLTLTFLAIVGAFQFFPFKYAVFETDHVTGVAIGIFALDQIMHVILFDAFEIFDLSFSGLRYDHAHPIVPSLVFAYRIFIAVSLLAALRDIARYYAIFAAPVTQNSLFRDAFEYLKRHAR